MGDSRLQLEGLLKDLRDNSVDGQAGLKQLHDFLFTQHSTSTDHGVLHWFCNKVADPLVPEAATFLLRLHAYDSPKVKVWREKLQIVLGGCVGCAKRLEEVKESSRTTYFGAYPDATLHAFWSDFAQWQRKLLVADLVAAGVAPDSSSVSSLTLADLPLPLFYRVFCTPSALDASAVRTLVLSMLPSKPRSTTPYPPPVYLIYAIVDEDDELRNWALEQLRLYPKRSIKNGDFVGPYYNAVRVILEALDGSFPPDTHIKVDTTILWRALSDLLPQLPLQAPEHRKTALEIRDTVRSHLPDDTSQFPFVLRCLTTLLRHLNTSFWEGEDPSLAHVIFTAVKDNSAYSRLVETMGSNDDQDVAWLINLLHTLWDSPAWGEIFQGVMQFLLGGVGEAKFGDAEPIMIVVAAQLLQDLVKRCNGKEGAKCRPTLTAMLRAHADFVISVAFAASYSTSSWAQARTACRSLLEALFLSDVDAVRDGIKGACRAMHKDYKDTELAPPIINTVLWTRTFELVGGPGAREDADANCLLLRVVASSAHCAALNAAVFRETFTKNPNVEKTVTNVNAALTTFHVGFAEAFSGFTDSQPARAVESLLRKPGMVRAAIALLMSPSPDLQAAGKALIGQAFDVDGRAETFRALFERLPNDTYEGVLACLGRYLEIAPALVEACAWSRAIVTCLTDVIDVLCASSSGILTGDRHFESVDQDDKPAARHLQPLWKKMADVSCLIFKRTPNWSRALGDEPEIRQMMTTWMRDALIFGRDILAYRRTFEDAIVRARQLGSTKRNEGVRDDVRKEVLGRLNPVFEETSRWLRLTDAELLHQSFSLFEGLAEALKSSDIRPPQAVLDKLKSQFKAGRQHQLDGMRMTKITQILADFDEEESDEEVEEVLPDSDDVVEVVPAPKAEERPIVVKPKMAVGNWLSAATSKSKPKQTTRPPAPNVRSSAAMNDIRRAAVAAQPRFSKKDIIRGGPPNPRLASSSRTPLPLPPLREGHRIKSESASVASSEANSSDSSEDSDGEPKGLAALGNFVKTPKIKKPVERRTIMVVDDVDVKLKRGHFGRFNRADEARRTAMRLKPDVSTLHRIVLGWDYEHSGDMPPDMQEKSRPSRVSDTFGSYGDYRRTFETLLIIEAWAGLVQSKSEPKETYPIKITSRQTVDDWTDMDIEITDTVRKEWYMSDVDVVLLKHPETDKYLLAKVQSYRAMRDSITGSLRVRLGNAASDPGLHINSKWVIAKIFSLATLHREYAALLGLEYYDLLSHILRPQLVRSTKFDEAEVKRTMALYSLNQPQAEAIVGSLQSEDFCLVQGPPGTGKTTTICGLVKACLARRARPLANPGKGAEEKVVLPKVLVCAPSNAAIDELASRLKDRGENVVRIGAEKSMNVSVRDISVDALVDAKLSTANVQGEGALKDAGERVKALRAQIESVKALRQQKENEFEETRNNLDKSRSLEEEIRKLKQQRTNLTQQLDKLRDQQRDGSRTLDSMRRRFRNEVLQEADVICSTLSGAGHEVLSQFDSFEMVVIDEAAQAIELSALIPLKYKCKRCVMVGDPQQLPPTVLSMEAKKFQYDQSLFVRLQKQRQDVVYLLSIQYRMHPDISELPSEVFYSGRLQDGPGMAEKTKQAWHSNALFPPYRFFNVQGQETPASSGSSLVNRLEAQVAAALYDRLQKDFAQVDFSFRVGVVSMYRAQIQELRRTFTGRFGPQIAEKVDFNTVDGFQGQEKDIIILSCVRASPGGTSVGFLADVRRMNVALTRARSSLFILGNVATLQRSDENWKTIIANARSRSHLADGTIAYFAQPGKHVVPPLTTIQAPTKTAKRKAAAISGDVPPGLAPQALRKQPSRSTDQEPDVAPEAVRTAASEAGLSRASSPATLSVRSSSPMTVDDAPPPRAPVLAPPPRAGPSRPVPGPNAPLLPPKKKKKPNAMDVMFIPRKKPT